jgi:hypothetical protein
MACSLARLLGAKASICATVVSKLLDRKKYTALLSSNNNIAEYTISRANSSRVPVLCGIFRGKLKSRK